MVRAKSIYRDAKALAAGYLKDPAMLAHTGRAVVVGAVNSLKGKRGAAPVVPVAFSREYEHTFGTNTELPGTPEQVMGLLLDFPRYGEWLALHVSWPDGAPNSISEGATYLENVKVLGTPARVRWTVTHFDPPQGFAIEGTGPMGVSAGLWFSATPCAAGVAVCVTGGFHSSALKGPMGSLVVSTLQSATNESVGALANLLVGRGGGASAGAAAAPTRQRRPPAGPRPAAVHHLRTDTTIDPWTPVVVGVGQVTHRPAGADLRDPICLAAEAARGALDGKLPAQRVRVSAVSTTSWVYGEQQAALLAAELGITATELVLSAPLGGDGPLRLLNDAAEAISEGDIDAAVIAGAESFASLAAAQKAGVTPQWNRTVPASQPTATRRIGSDKQGNNEAEDAAGLLTPVYMYALMESALRGLKGVARTDHQRHIAELWSRFSAVAAGNPFAWLPQPYPAAAIGEPSPDNRMVATPYPKLMTANLTVDQGAAMVLCSAAAAEAAGIPQDQWVFVHAGAHAEEQWFVSERNSIAEVPAIAAMGKAVLAHAGIGIDEVTHVDLYSCFPFAVQAAAAELGLALDDPERPLTQTGGLTFAGGPLNNYSSHGAAAMVTALRKEPEAFGLCTALGWYATKHAATVLSCRPPSKPFHQVDAGLRMARPPRRETLAGYTGAATVEGATVTYGADGQPDGLIVSALTATGARVLSRATDPALIEAALSSDVVGGVATCAKGAVTELAVRENGLAQLSELVRSTPVHAEPPLRVEWEGPLCVITLNRPQVRNAVDLDLAVRLESAIDAFEADPQARVAILTGAGGDFCTGMDLKAAASGQYPITVRRGLLGLAGKPPVKPLIAAVEGYALAGGCELALASDLIVAAQDAQFGLPEAKRGLVAAAGGVLRLAQRLPRGVALELAFTGAPMGAARLHTLGLVNQLTERGGALAAARELALAIAANAPMSVEISKQIVDEHADWSVAEAYGRQAELGSAAAMSDDAAEGVRAFTEKRAPRWTGR